MKILLIGASGTVGRAVAARLAHHQLITASRHDSDFPVDITDQTSIQRLFERTGPVDAIIATTGSLHFAPLAEMTPEQFGIGIASKLMGQVNLVLIGQHYLNEQGSITLTGGILSHDPIRQGSNASTVNAALEGFVRGAAIELGRQRRINLVSPDMLAESAGVYGSFFPGHAGVSGEHVAGAYVKSVEGAQTGQIYRLWGVTGHGA